ncbi:MAG: rRNA maturation RNase YbeY [Mycoplasmataceae bacterium]|jgi:probable rRNA maturation factor|nr:rRNA maturation RNase YbeY [Mycoplasmataceae bacterium]
MLQFFVNNQFNLFKVDKQFKKKVQDICTQISQIHKNDALFEISFINDSYMKKLNNKYAKNNHTTDVLSFTINEHNLLGEIFISVPFAKKEAQRLNTTFQQEIYLLIIHGILHLIGFDHCNKTQTKVMFDLQDKILKQILI